MKISVKISEKIASSLRDNVVIKLWVLFNIMAVNVTPAAANEVTLRLKPSQCIAIHQGKTCYVDVKLRWQTQEKGAYCLYSSQQNDPLKCWSQANTGQYEREVLARKNVLFRLRESKSGEVIISKELEMAWIYKRNAKSRSSWRMF